MWGKAIGVVILFALWSLGSGWYYICTIKGVCSEQVKQQEPVITFSRNSSDAIVSNDLKGLEENIASRLGTNGKLVVTGLYDIDELNQSNAENLGIARALSVVEVLSFLDSNRMIVASEEVSFDEENQPLDAVKFRVLASNDEYMETIDGAIVYVSTNFANGITQSKLAAYLTYVAKEYGENQIDVVGYNFSAGNEAQNFEVALENANYVREELIDRGMQLAQVIASSKGQTVNGMTQREEPMKDIVEIVINQR